MLQFVNLSSKFTLFPTSAPDFVYTFEDGDYVYIMFKEIDAEKYPETVYSRVARICKTDEGSQNTFWKDNFLTYVKARLYCSYNRDGSPPYEFNSICEFPFQQHVFCCETDFICEAMILLDSFYCEFRPKCLIYLYPLGEIFKANICIIINNK